MIPYFEDLILPFLKIISDGKAYNTIQVRDKLAKLQGLSKDELNEYLPSGRKKVFDNRVQWAKAHLNMADFIVNTPQPMQFKITKEGQRALESNPTRIDINFLKNYQNYYDKFFRKKKVTKNINNDSPTIDNNEDQNKQTPEEIIYSNYNIIKDTLAVELLEKIKKKSPGFFEKLVIDLLLNMGYGDDNLKKSKKLEVGIVTGKSGDGGIDGIIYQDFLGLEAIYIQAKRYEKKMIGSPDIQKFAGALTRFNVERGIFLTTSHFTDAAKKYFLKDNNETKVVLIDGDQLAKYMIDYNLAVTTSNEIIIKQIDNDYFEEE